MSDREIGVFFKTIMESVVSFDHCIIFAYHGSERPLDLYSTFSSDDYFVFVTLYQEGPYLLDPFYRNASQRRAGLFRMRDLAPDRFFSSEYFRNYYEKTGLAEELGFFIPIPGDVTIVLSLMRKAKSGSFTPADLATLNKTLPFVRQIVSHYWGHLADRVAKPQRASDGSGQGEDGAGRAWSGLNLTGREIAIIEKVLQGFSSESIGLQLNIATGTVKVHRRNIYRKLGISSQTQLLSLYLENLKDTR